MLEISANDGLILIDVQNDFCPGGALAVPDGDGVVRVCNRLTARFGLTILTADWHPPGHASFASTHNRSPYDTVELGYGRQVLWPDHCVAGTRGAEFHPDLNTDHAALIVRKGHNPEIDSYSGFFENDRQTPTGLAGALRDLGVQRLFLAGLATDFCVRFTALDGREAGFEVTVIEDAVRGIDLDGSLAAAWTVMGNAGVQRITSEDLS